MAGLQKTFDDISKKYSKLKKSRDKLQKEFKSFIQATALQLKTWSIGMEKMSETMKVMSIGIDKRFNLLEKKPCMKIKTILTEKELDIMRSHLALSG